MYKLDLTLTPGQAGALAGVHSDTIRNWILNNGLPARQTLSGRWLIKETDLADFLRKKEAAQNSPITNAHLQIDLTEYEDLKREEFERLKKEEK